LRFSQRFCFRFKFSWVFGQWCTNFPKIRSHRKILVSRRVTRSKFRTDGGRISDNVHNLAAPMCYFMSTGYATDVPNAPLSFLTPLTLSTGILRLPWLRFFRAFSSVVRQMPGYTSQRRGTVRTLPNW